MTTPTRPAMHMRRARGFTLIEVMITVAIIALLAAIAYPSYQDSVWKGKRGEAKAAILRALQAEERFYTQNNTYVAYASGSAPSGAFPNFSADSASNSRYRISVSATGAAPLCPPSDITRCAVVTATVIGTSDPTCGTSLSMDTVGNKLPALTGATAACWR